MNLQGLMVASTARFRSSRNCARTSDAQGIERRPDASDRAVRL